MVTDASAKASPYGGSCSGTSTPRSGQSSSMAELWLSGAPDSRPCVAGVASVKAREKGKHKVRCPAVLQGENLAASSSGRISASSGTKIPSSFSLEYRLATVEERVGLMATQMLAQEQSIRQFEKSSHIGRQAQAKKPLQRTSLEEEERAHGIHWDGESGPSQDPEVSWAEAYLAARVRDEVAQQLKEKCMSARTSRAEDEVGEEEGGTASPSNLPPTKRKKNGPQSKGGTYQAPCEPDDIEPGGNGSDDYIDSPPSQKSITLDFIQDMMVHNCSYKLAGGVWDTAIFIGLDVVGDFGSVVLFFLTSCSASLGKSCSCWFLTSPTKTS